MYSPEIEKKVIGLIEDVGSVAVGHYGATLTELDIDSLDQVELLQAFEQEFSIVFDDDTSFNGNNTVRDVLDRIHEVVIGPIG